MVPAYLLGLAIGQLGYGPLAERFGRKPATRLRESLAAENRRELPYAKTIEEARIIFTNRHSDPPWP